jgi:hypothetical protein
VEDNTINKGEIIAKVTIPGCSPIYNNRSIIKVDRITISAVLLNKLFLTVILSIIGISKM